jgi:S-adenosylmethionine:tRNA ribosyltransferase-isomerase
VSPGVRLEDLDYPLPPERIAQEPAPQRDAARLLVLERSSGRRHHARVCDLPGWLCAGDLLVRNATRVLPARLRGRKASGGAAEALLLGPAPEAPHAWRALVRCRGPLRAGLELHFEREGRSLDAEVAAVAADGEALLAFPAGADPYVLGETPLPPYVRRAAPRDDDAERYQTVYARVPGSVAAPTAGLHFTEALLGRLAEAGVASAEVVLHVGPGTFRPLRDEDLAAGRLHAERFELPPAAAQAVTAARARGGRVVAVGTTSARVLESCADDGGGVRAACGETKLLIAPGHRFRAVDALLTNFHLPRSSLLLLAAAFAGRETVLGAYAEALALGYRFYSYGDAMLIL